MATVITRGGTCRLAFYPQSGLRVEDLGTPSIGISQDITFLSPTAVVDSVNNRVYADLKEIDTIQLVENVETKVQLIFYNEDGEIVHRFPIHYVTVTETILDQVFEPESYIYDLVYDTVDGYDSMNPSELGWYEVAGNEYFLSDDDLPQQGTRYYTRRGPNDPEPESSSVFVDGSTDGSGNTGGEGSGTSGGESGTGGDGDSGNGA